MLTVVHAAGRGDPLMEDQEHPEEGEMYSLL